MSGKSVARCVDGEECGGGGEDEKHLAKQIRSVQMCGFKAVGADSPCRSAKTRKGSKEECTRAHRETARETESERRRDNGGGGRRESEKSAVRRQGKRVVLEKAQKGCWAGTGVV